MPASFARKCLALIVFACLPQLVWASKLKVVTTLPDLAEIARAVGKDEVTVEAMLNGTEDAHFIDASPAFIRRAASADVVCIIGLELETGWIPRVLAKTGKPSIQPGGAGFCETGKSVTVLDKKSGSIDRSMGDVHPSGNPHFTVSPKALAEAANEIAAALSRVRPEKSSYFEENKKGFQSEMQELEKRIREKLKPLLASIAKDRAMVIEYHREFLYFFELYGLKSFGAIEEKPGVPPSAARLAQVSASAKAAGVRVALGSIHSPEKQMRRFEELSGIPTKRIPAALEAQGQASTIAKLQDLITDTLLSSVAK